MREPRKHKLVPALMMANDKLACLFILFKMYLAVDIAIFIDKSSQSVLCNLAGLKT